MRNLFLHFNVVEVVAALADKHILDIILLLFEAAWAKLICPWTYLLPKTTLSLVSKVVELFFGAMFLFLAVEGVAFFTTPLFIDIIAVLDLGTAMFDFKSI